MPEKINQGLSRLNLDTHRDRAKSKNLGAAAYIFKRDTEPRELLVATAEIIKKSREKKKKT